MTEAQWEKEFIEMAERCKNEIIMMRSHIARLTPKAEAYDRLGAILDLLPRQSMGMGEDLVFIIDKRLAQLKHKHDTKVGE